MAEMSELKAISGHEIREDIDYNTRGIDPEKIVTHLSGVSAFVGAGSLWLRYYNEELNKTLARVRRRWKPVAALL